MNHIRIAVLCTAYEMSSIDDVTSLIAFYKKKYNFLLKQRYILSFLGGYYVIKTNIIYGRYCWTDKGMKSEIINKGSYIIKPTTI